MLYTHQGLLAETNFVLYVALKFKIPTEELKCADTAGSTRSKSLTCLFTVKLAITVHDQIIVNAVLFSLPVMNEFCYNKCGWKRKWKKEEK